MAYRDSQASKTGNPISFNHIVKDAARWAKAFTAEELAKAASIECWCSSFDDPGDDWNEWRLLDAAGTVVATRHAAGY